MKMNVEELAELLEKLREDPPVGSSILTEQELATVRGLVEYQFEILSMAERRRAMDSVFRMLKQIRERLDLLLALGVGVLASQNESVKEWFRWLGTLMSSP